MSLGTTITAADFNTVYGELLTKGIDNNGLFQKIKSMFIEDFNAGGYDNTTGAEALAAFYGQAYGVLEQQLHSSTLGILKSSYDVDLVKKQAMLVSRETAGYNDQLRVKKAEFSSQVASFALNSSPATAQGPLDVFNKAICDLGKLTWHEVDSKWTYESGTWDNANKSCS